MRWQRRLRWAGWPAGPRRVVLGSRCCSLHWWRAPRNRMDRMAAPEVASGAGRAEWGCRMCSAAGACRIPRGADGCIWVCCDGLVVELHSFRHTYTSCVVAGIVAIIRCRRSGSRGPARAMYLYIICIPRRQRRLHSTAYTGFEQRRGGDGPCVCVVTWCWPGSIHILDHLFYFYHNPTNLLC